MPSPQFRFWLPLALLVTTCICSVTGFCSSFAISTTTMPLSRNSVVVVCAEKKPVPHRATRTLYKPKHGEERLVFEVMELEKDIRESTKARLDMQRVAELLEEDTTTSMEKTHAEDWQISLAASSVAAAVTLGVTDSWTFAVLALAGTYILANGDPLEEQAPYGAAARVVGRATFSSIQTLQPKVRAVARVALKGDNEVALLKHRIEELEVENTNLRLWQQRRNAVDDSLSHYTIEELKFKANQHNLPVGGSKTQLLMRLVEAEAIKVM